VKELALPTIGSALVGAGLIALGIGDGPSATRTVEMRDFVFRPARIEVDVGDTVVWLNRDALPHTATARGAWDSGGMASGARWSWVASRRDTVEYICTYHPTMRGTIVVR